MSEPFFGIDRPGDTKPLSAATMSRPSEERLRALLDRDARVPRQRVIYVHPTEWQYFRDMGVIGPNGEIW